MADDRNRVLAEAKSRLRELQRQISDKILKATAEVDGLLKHLSPRETKNFLRGACEITSSDAAAYIRISQHLKGSENILRAARVQFPVMKALAGSDVRTREEALFRIQAGALLETRDVSALRANFRKMHVSPAELMSRTVMRNNASAARQRVSKALSLVDKGVAEVLVKIDALRFGSANATKEEKRKTLQSLSQDASKLIPQFETAYGRHSKTISDLLDEGTEASERRLGLAYHALQSIADGAFAKTGTLVLHPDRRPSQRTHVSAVLRTFTSRTFSNALGPPAGAPAPRSLLPAKRLKVIELCAGAGGLSLGLEKAGFEPVALIEYDKKAAATLRANRPNWNVVEADMKTVDYAPFRSQRVDLLAGGLPCQPYSVEGKSLGKNDPRDLLLEGARAVAEIKPAAFCFENVAGLLHARHADHLGSFMSIVRKKGYAVWIHRMEAEHYGVAQERTRILIVGMRDGLLSGFRAPPTFPQWRFNIGDAIGDLMAENGWIGAKAWAEARRNTVVVRNGVELKGVLASTVVGRKGGPRDKERDRWGRKGIDIRNVADHAPTQVEADASGAKFLPSLTLRMRARLQGFPDTWLFTGGKESAARQIGNAVPPVIGQAIGLAIHGALENISFDFEGMLESYGAGQTMSSRQLDVDTHRTLVEAPPLAPSVLEHSMIKGLSDQLQ